MKDVLVYRPPDTPAQAALFIESLEPKLREKLLRQIIPLPRMPPPPSCGNLITNTLPWSDTAVFTRFVQKAGSLSESPLQFFLAEESCFCAVL